MMFFVEESRDIKLIRIVISKNICLTPIDPAPQRLIVAVATGDTFDQLTFHHSVRHAQRTIVAALCAWGQSKMIVGFFAALAAIHPFLPFFVRTLILVVVATIVWVVISVPAFWLCRSIGALLSTGIKQLSELRHRLFGRAVELFQTAASPVEEFLTTHARLFDFFSENARIEKALNSIRRSIEGVPDDLNQLEAGLGRSSQNFQQCTDRIGGVEVPEPVVPPTPEQFVLVKAAANRAWATLILALLLTPPLVVFNWGMLTKFLEGQLGAGQELLDFIPLTLVLAGGATLLEIILGAWLARTTSRAFKLLMISCLVGLALIECFLYGLMGLGMSTNPVEPLYSPAPAPAWSKMWFGLFGPILVSALAACGHYLVTSILQLSDRNVVQQWKGFIRGRIRSAETLRARLEGAVGGRAKLLGLLAELKENFSTAIAAKEDRAGIVRDLKHDIVGQLERAAAIRLPNVVPLSRGAMIVKLCEWIFMAAAIPIAAWALHLAFLWSGIGSGASGIGTVGLAWVLAIIQSLALLIGGNAANRSSATLATEGERAPPHRQYVMWFVSLGALVAIILCDAFWTLGGDTGANIATFFIMLVVALMVFWCGTQLGHIWATLWCILRCLFNALAATAPALGGIAVTATELLALLIRAALMAAAYPYSILFLKDGTGSKLAPWGIHEVHS
jgi:ABC-type multidrug transport system fused ATPase/permease subunit